MKIITVHGFNVWDGGAGTIGQIEPYLTILHEVCDFDYGWIGLLGVKLFGKKIARRLAKQTPDGAIGVGHSNGCMELIRACEYGAKFKVLVFINPALDNDIEIPDCVEKVYVYYNQFDTTVTMAKYYPFSYWGDMGRVGYKGDSDKVECFETWDLFRVRAHSGIFKRPYHFVEHLNNLLLQHA